MADNKYRSANKERRIIKKHKETQRMQGGRYETKKDGKRGRALRGGLRLVRDEMLAPVYISLCNVSQSLSGGNQQKVFLKVLNEVIFDELEEIKAQRNKKS